MHYPSLYGHDDRRRCYERDGFLVVPRLLPGPLCESLKQEALRMMAVHVGPEATVMVGVAVHSPRFRTLSEDPRLLELIAPLMPDGIMFLSDKFVFKSGAKSFATPWHVDQAYWQGTRAKISIWLALDPATIANGCLKIVRAGHRRDWGHRSDPGLTTNHEFQATIAAPAWDVEDEVPCTLDQGGAVVFGDRLPHGSFANTSGEDRYALILTYQAPAADEPFDLAFPARRVLRPSSIDGG